MELNHMLQSQSPLTVIYGSPLVRAALLKDRVKPGALTQSDCRLMI
jgi:hypothetical protein